MSAMTSRAGRIVTTHDRTAAGSCHPLTGFSCGSRVFHLCVPSPVFVHPRAPPSPSFFSARRQATGRFFLSRTLNDGSQSRDRADHPKNYKEESYGDQSQGVHGGLGRPAGSCGSAAGPLCLCWSIRFTRDRRSSGEGRCTAGLKPLSPSPSHPFRDQNFSSTRKPRGMCSLRGLSRSLGRGRARPGDSRLGSCLSR